MDEDNALLAALLRSFLHRAPGLLLALHSAVETQDSRQVEYLAHALKGAALNLGAADLGQLCNELEMHGHNCELTASRPALRSADAELSALTPVLHTLAEELTSTHTSPPQGGA